jgi:two-component system, sensor histidine kinase and response regulator
MAALLARYRQVRGLYSGPIWGPMEQSQPKPKILVVDDNAQNRALAQATLEDEDYLVLLASSGEEGVALFEAEHPDCVLLDVRMPGTDGFAVCSRIRALPGGADTPIVFLTALRDVETFDRALRVGGDDFLTKPFRPTELVVRVQAALKLRRMSSELREHYELVRRQRDDLMRLQMQKERLTSFVVHDLKNPVNSMDLHAQLLLRDAEVPARARESVLRIREEARSLLRLLLNLLDISKSEEGALNPRYSNVDVKALVAEILDAHEVKAQAVGVSLTHSIDAQSVSADKDLLRRVIENLLDNAIRHAPERTEVRVTATLRDDIVEIRIADAGPGVLPEMRQKIFERFVQVESGERLVTRTGRGLGLTFCKLAIEAHGGTISVEEATPGTVFCLRLPA